MIDFLQYFFGINEEAGILALMLLSAGLVGSFAASRFLIFQPDDNKTDILTLILLGITFLIAAAAGIPLFILLITFKLNYILTALLIAAVPSALFFWLVYSVTFGLRMAKYMRNPITQDVLSFARQHDVAGIQCFADGVRFFSALENNSYCTREAKTVKEFTFAAYNQAKSNPPRPQGFEDYANSSHSLGILRFSDHGYSNLPDLPFFGKVLSKNLRGFACAHHTVTVNYDETSPGKIVHHICRVHEDCFVYKKSAKVPRRIARKQAKQAASAAAKQQEKQAKKWE